MGSSNAEAAPPGTIERTLALLVVACIAAACASGGEAPAGTVDDGDARRDVVSGPEDIGEGDISLLADADDATSPDDGEDGEHGDSGAGSDAEDDAAAADASADADVGDIDDGGVALSFGARCDADEDCASRRCDAPVDGQPEICTVTCVSSDDCPGDARCDEIEGGDRLCVPPGGCVDRDEDGFGVGLDCEMVDCDDTDPAIHPDAEEHCDGVDEDCDGRVDDEPVDVGGSCEIDRPGACSAGVERCARGELVCTETVAPSPERCDGVDNDCDGEIDEADAGGPLTQRCYPGEPRTRGVGRCRDGEQRCDGGRWLTCVGAVLPTVERCDGVDEDCDALVDEGLDTSTWYRDRDGDGFGSDDESIEACSGRDGLVEVAGDCDDSDPDVSPDASEQPGDGVDSDCDGIERCYVDGDGDGYRGFATLETDELDCDVRGAVTADAPGGDCDDFDDAVFPDAVEAPGDGVDSNCDGVELCYVDADADGVRTTATIESRTVSCDAPGLALASAPSGDCDDSESTVAPGLRERCDGLDNDCNGAVDDLPDGAFLWPDVDGDGFGDGASDPVDACDAGDGFVPNADDCDDTDGDIHPGADEIVGDGIDSDCDGVELCLADADADGFRPSVESTVESDDADCDDPGEATADTPSGDCDDTEARAHPGREEVVGDGIDNDCDGLELCYRDLDGDGVRADATSTIASSDRDCSDRGEASADDPIGDCDDRDDDVYPGADEIADDGVDSNCDGMEVCFVDADGDGVRPDASATVLSADLACDGPGEARAREPVGDCDDTDPEVFPGAEEEPSDGVDANCDGRELCYVDSDGDGYRVDGATRLSERLACDGPSDAAAGMPGGDCNDRDPGVNPGARETIDDGEDSDCDGFELCYVDADRDGYRPDAISTVASDDLTCTAGGEAEEGDPIGDCDDGDPRINPGRAESPGDGVDADCDGLELCYIDGDGDGARRDRDETILSPRLGCDGEGEATRDAPGVDCDDEDPAVFPGAEERVGDGVDSNCDGVERCFVDADDDGFRAADGETVVSTTGACTGPGEALAALPGGDCDDGDDDIYPEAPDTIGDGVDSDCDGEEVCFVDFDGDGYRPDAVSTVRSIDLDCDDPGEARAGEPVGDCDDRDSLTSPIGIEIPGDGDDSDCDGEELCFVDFDGDGYRPPGDELVTSPDLSCDGPGEAVRADEVGDCDDRNADVHPGQDELIADGLDNDCDGFEECYGDGDGDGHRATDGRTVISTDLRCDGEGELTATAPADDCNDDDPTIFGGAVEGIADGIDSNCDGLEICYVDADDDGYRTGSLTTVTVTDIACVAPGHARASDPTGDCDDRDPTRNPGIDADLDGVDSCSDCNDGFGAVPNGRITYTVEGPFTLGDLLITRITFSLTPLETIEDLDVLLNIDHTKIGDLTIDLVSPAGTRVRLFDRYGGVGDDITNLRLSDEAPTGVWMVGAPFSGTYRPPAALSAFDGQSLSGSWMLEVIDNANGSDGLLIDFALDFDLACR